MIIGIQNGRLVAISVALKLTKEGWTSTNDQSEAVVGNDSEMPSVAAQDVGNILGALLKAEVFPCYDPSLSYQWMNQPSL